MISIRPVNKPDLDKLREIGKATFIEAFADDNTASDMANYLEEKFSQEQLTAEWSHPESLFYFAEAEGQVAGYLKVNWREAQTEQLLENALEIERIYVLSEYYGKGVGKALFNKAYAIAKEKMMDAIWLGVWEKNARAVAFYRKNGFVKFGAHPFYLGDEKQTDILMKLEL